MGQPRVYRSKNFKSWYKSLNFKEKAIVDTRIDTFREKGLLLKSKVLDPKLCLYEFKWMSGLRVYYAFMEDSEGRLMLLLLGGNKNSQQGDITLAKNILKKAASKIENKNKRLKDFSPLRSET